MQRSPSECRELGALRWPRGSGLHPAISAGCKCLSRHWLMGNASGFRAGHHPPPQGPKHCCVPAGTRWTRACISCRASSSESLSAKTCSLFLPNYVQDKYLLQLLRSADDVSTWVAAEIVTSHTSKVGA